MKVKRTRSMVDREGWAISPMKSRRRERIRQGRKRDELRRERYRVAATDEKGLLVCA